MNNKLFNNKKFLISEIFSNICFSIFQWNFKNIFLEVFKWIYGIYLLKKNSVSKKSFTLKKENYDFLSKYKYKIEVLSFWLANHNNESKKLMVAWVFILLYVLSQQEVVLFYSAEVVDSAENIFSEPLSLRLSDMRFCGKWGCSWVT